MLIGNGLGVAVGEGVEITVAVAVAGGSGVSLGIGVACIVKVGLGSEITTLWPGRVGLSAPTTRLIQPDNDKTRIISTDNPVIKLNILGLVSVNTLNRDDI